MVFQERNVAARSGLVVEMDRNGGYMGLCEQQGLGMGWKKRGPDSQISVF